MSKYVLAIDAGNTRIKFGWFESAADPTHLPDCLEFAAVRCDEAPPWSIIRTWAGGSGSDWQGAITGSNPRAVQTVQREWPTDFAAPVILSDYRDFPLTIALPFPERVGIDRLLNAVAGSVVRRSGQGVVIVDSGTATTIDALDAEGRFVGGAILPGLELSAKALHHYTALLPEIPRSDFSADAPAPIGRDTSSALQSGIYWGQVGAIAQLVERVSSSLATKPGGRCLVLLTGGGAPVLRPQLPVHYQWEPALPMQGLALTMAAKARQRPGQRT